MTNHGWKSDTEFCAALEKCLKKDHGLSDDDMGIVYSEFCKARVNMTYFNKSELASGDNCMKVITGAIRRYANKYLGVL